jgi:hypothetical protein
MHNKLTLTVDVEVYEGLRKTIGPRKISKFIENLVRPHVIHPDLDLAYAERLKTGHEKKQPWIGRNSLSRILMMKRHEVWWVNPGKSKQSHGRPTRHLK